MIDALRVTTPDVGVVARSLLGVLAMAAGRDGVGFSVGCGVGGRRCGDRGRDCDAGQPRRAGADGHHCVAADGGRRVPRRVDRVAQCGFLCVVAVWCFAAGMQWALGGKPGLVAAAAMGLLVVSPPIAPSLTAVVFSTLLTVAAGCVQAVLIAVFPPRRWRAQRDALTRAYRALAADARGVAADREASVRAAPFTSLREAFADTEATRRPLAYHGGYRLPERITATLDALRGGDDGVSQLLSPAADFLDAIANHKPHRAAGRRIRAGPG